MSYKPADREPVVLNEAALCYVYYVPGSETIHVSSLREKVSGRYYCPGRNGGDLPYLPSVDTLRPATLADFAEYRVMPPRSMTA